MRHASGYPTRTIIIIGSTTTQPGGPLYTLTSLGDTGCVTPTPTSTLTQTPTPTIPAVWYQIFDCGNSSVAYSIAYTAGVFANNERCTAAASGYPTRTIIIIGSTTTEPGGPLYTLTSLGRYRMCLHQHQHQYFNSNSNVYCTSYLVSNI